MAISCGGCEETSGNVRVESEHFWWRVYKLLLKQLVKVRSGLHLGETSKFPTVE